MTEKQKKAFLKAEGWKPSSIMGKGFWMKRLPGKPGNRLHCHISGAYRIASRRKRQREARALRNAGWSFSRELGFWDNGDCMLYPREVALQTLEAQP